MYGCSTAATLAASSSSSADIESDLVDSVRERVAELSGSDSTSSMDPSDVDEDPGYRVSIIRIYSLLWLSILVFPLKHLNSLLLIGQKSQKQGIQWFLGYV